MTVDTPINTPNNSSCITSTSVCLVDNQQDNHNLEIKLKEQEKTFNTVQRSQTQMNEVFEKISTQVLKKDSLELSEKNADLLNPLKTQIETQ
jgi:hypothetical protein